MFCHPLLLLDHGPASDRSIAAAVGLAQRLRSRLTIVHAIDERGTWVGAGSAMVFAQHEELIVLGQRLLAGARDRMPADLPCDTRLLRAPAKPAKQALELAERDGHDVLIAGCECHPAPGWHVFGCDAHWLLHHARVPVLSVTDATTLAAPAAEDVQAAAQPD